MGQANCCCEKGEAREPIVAKQISFRNKMLENKENDEQGDGDQAERPPEGIIL